MALAGSFLDVAGLKARTVAPPGLVDGAHTSASIQWQTFVESRLKVHTSRLKSRLRKRYGELAEPYPEIVLGWLVDLVTLDLYERRGFDPADEQAQRVAAAAELANKESLEAADAEEGLFDIPINNNSTSTGISKGDPLAYSEASPYEWTDRQRESLE